MQPTKEIVRWAARRKGGVEIGGYRHTAVARRQQMRSHYGVDLLVDVGANVGQYALEQRRAGYRGRLLSLEPLASAYRELEAAAAEDSLWQTHRLALGDSAGELTMNVSEASIFSSALPILDQAVATAPQAKPVATETVTVTRLDDLLQNEMSRCLAIKIDVQGFERQVLAGGPASIEKARIVELELSPSPVYDGQMLLMETVERMQDAGLVLSLTENLFPDFASGRSLQFNGVFVRP
jgi:FkbM family methyltransferase